MTMTRTARKKQRIAIMCSAAACAAFLLAAGSCAIPAMTQNLGSLTVSISTDSSTARSIRPDFEASIDTVNLTLSLNGSTTVVTKSFSSTNGAALFENLEPGTWTLTADAFISGTEVGSGMITVAITGGSQSVYVPITFSRGSGTSAFSIPVAWPASAGIDYAAVSIDGGTATELAVAASATTYTTTISSTLSTGAHTLRLSFKRGGASGASAGTFVESVNVYSGYVAYTHVKSDGSIESAWNFSASDFFSANANLAGIAFSVGGTSVDIGFGSSTTTYTADIGNKTSVSATPTESIAGQYITYSWNGGGATALASGTPVTFTPGDTNTLAFTVRAPDGSTTKTYTLKINKTGSASISFTLNPSYGGLTVSAGTLLVESDDEIDFSVDATGLGTVSAYAWYVDGALQTNATGSTFTFSSGTNGNHSIGVVATAGGVQYSGNALVTVYSTASCPYYNGNGADSGSGPDDGVHVSGDTYTLWDNVTNGNGVTFLRSGYSFAGWNTKADGTGDSYAANASYTFGTTSVTFYAQWTNIAPAAPTNLLVNANIEQGYAILSWTDPTEKDIAYIAVSDGTRTYQVSKGTQQFLFTGITGTTTFMARAYDGAGNWSAMTVDLTCVSTAAEALACLQGLRNGSISGSMVLGCDVDLGAWTSPIATFTGMIDGGGHTITLGTGSTSGLFGTLAATSTVKNFNIRGDVSFPAGTSTTATKYYGLLANVSNGNLADCSASGTLAVNIDSTGLSCIGGIAGYINTSGTVQNCWSDTDLSVTFSVHYNQADVGGFAGYVTKGTISSCYAVGNVMVTGAPTRDFVGGFVGKHGDSSPVIRNCYARGTVTVNDSGAYDDYLGGFAGTVATGGLIENCYSAGKVNWNSATGLSGGFTGNMGGTWTSGPGTLTDCYYDNSTSGQTGSFANGQSTALMKDGNFSNWDFGAVWATDPSINDGYPCLRSFGANTVTP